ncbi:MAG TPA: helix-turn-helix transcriptional regulator [Methylovirgula sp.]|nr:helix-turn-helix transcriptional regulator [Methylovirgula sp.]
MNHIESCSNLLLELYQAAITTSPESFQTTALRLVDQAIGFDRAWWGIMAQKGSGFDLHSSHRYELPDAFETQWEAIKSDDSLARDAHGKPRTTIHFDEKGLRSTPGLAELNDGHDLRQALCTSAFLPDRKSFLFVSLFRSGVRTRTFKQHEIALKQLLTPHLYACWRVNLLAELQRHQFGNNLNKRGVAFVDRQGTIVCTDASFAALLTERWPAWRGPRLPKMLMDAFVSRDASSNRECLDLHVAWIQTGGLYRFEIRCASALDRLTPREREIAEYFAQAQSYKDIAARTALAPSTVRHHLRTIYAKLDISDKAQLVRLVDNNGGSSNRQRSGSALPDDGFAGFDFLGPAAR